MASDGLCSPRSLHAGEWEPVLEPWHIGLEVSKLQAVPEELEEEALATAPAPNKGPSIKPPTTAPERSAPKVLDEFHIRLGSKEPLELNLSPAFMSSAHALLHVVTVALEATSAQSEAALLALRRSMGTVTANSVAVRNCTELPMAIAMSSRAFEAPRAIAPGAEVTLVDEGVPAYEAFSQRSSLFAETTENLDLVYAARHNPLELFIELLERPCMQVLTTAPSPHRYAARYNQLELFIELLERHANLNSYDAKRRTALHAAVKHRHHTIVRLLLRAGASVNVPTLDGAMTTPLHLAAMSGDLALARLLLEAHADPALTNSDGENTAGVAAGHVEVQRLLYAPPPFPTAALRDFPAARPPTDPTAPVRAAARASSGSCMRVLTTAPAPALRQGAACECSPQRPLTLLPTDTCISPMRPRARESDFRRRRSSWRRRAATLPPHSGCFACV